MSRCESLCDMVRLFAKVGEPTVVACMKKRQRLRYGSEITLIVLNNYKYHMNVATE